jgi:ribonuclease VapC
MRRAVVDSFAVLAWLKDEPGVRFVRSLFAAAEQGELRLLVCAVNLGEVYYITAKERGMARAEAVLGNLLHLPWNVLPVTNELVWAAARLKARFRISYADAFALACAQEQEAELVTNDPELCAAQHGVAILWEPA